MNDELTKRKNPFEVKRTSIVEEEPIEETFSPEEEQEIEEEPVKVVPEPVARPTYTERSTVRTAKPAKNTRYVETEEAAREKYTSTMDIELRRTIKILCATRGIMFAQFVEDACREKLKREGVR